MTNKNFTHLHVHSEYSLLDGYARIEKTLDRAKELGMKSLAITDHGVMYGCIKFFKEAKKRGIKPIIGCEIYTSPNSYLSKTPNDRYRNHLILLCKDEVGYKNLIKIVSEAFIHGFYYKPRVDRSVLRKNSKGLICLSGCLQGEIPQLILNSDYESAKNLAMEYDQIYGRDNFYLELQDHGIKDQALVNKYLNRIHEETGIPMVCTNDVHYTNKEDHDAHEILLLIQTGKTINDPDRMSFKEREFYLKDYDEMYALFKNYEGAIENTQHISDKCNFEFDFTKRHLPKFDLPEGYTNVGYLRELVYDGLKKRYGVINDIVRKRAEKELKTIESMGFVDYFLIVWDFVRYAKSVNIKVGPGRGSAAGSIVSYALTITEIDPIKYGLLFERFLNPERVSMPDIDIDFCYERRDEVIDYVKEKYGKEHVTQIVTFGTMKAKNAIRDVGRALDVSLSKVDYIAKLVPENVKITIDEALEINKDLSNIYKEDEDAKRVIDYAKALEFMPRHTSTHPAGVVIASKKIDELVPLSLSKGQITSEYDKSEIEELGLLKMDFLGLRTLTVIQDALTLIKKNYGKEIDILKIDLRDKKLLDIFARAETVGIFQFESLGMRNFLKDLKPDRFEDLIAANALFRPGPMDQIPTYIEYRHNPENVKFIHPSLENILKDTYGVIVYQEQVMDIRVKLAGYSMGRADNLRRAMSGKDMQIILDNRKGFVYGEEDESGNILINGCIRNGISEDIANEIFDLMVDFAKYAFNKSHSVAYAFVAMETAFLKVYYPKEFMASLISSVMNDSNKVSLYIQEAKACNVSSLGPDINRSFKKFSVEDDKIRFGLLAIKNVGSNLIDRIVEEREKNGYYKDLSDFIYRLSQDEYEGLNKKAVESMIKAGCFSSFDKNRAQMMASFENIMDIKYRENKRNVRGQTSFFDQIDSFNDNDDSYPNLKEYSKKELLLQEKEVLGIYVSGHPFDSYSKIAEKYIDSHTIDFTRENLEDSGRNLHAKYSLAGIITELNVKFTKKNQQMAFFKIEDLYGSIEVVCFPRQYRTFKQLIVEDRPVVIRGSLDLSQGDEVKILLDNIMDLEKIDNDKIKINEYNRINKGILYLQMDSNRKYIIEECMKILKRNKGKSRVLIYLRDKKIKLSNDKLRVDINKEMINDLEKLLGRSNVVCK